MTIHIDPKNETITIERHAVRQQAKPACWCCTYYRACRDGEPAHPEFPFQLRQLTDDSVAVRWFDVVIKSQWAAYHTGQFCAEFRFPDQDVRPLTDTELKMVRLYDSRNEADRSAGFDIHMGLL